MSDKTVALSIVPAPDVDRDPYYGRRLIERRVRESISVKRALLADALVARLEELSGHVVESLREGGKLILFGNGGSAADATHLAAEFVGRFAFDRDPMPALSLSDNGSSVTAIGNDYAYDVTFARQMRAFGAAGDIAVALSTSGRSANVLGAVEVARDRGLITVAFTGSEGSELAELVDWPFMMPSAATARIQEGYMLYAHILCELVEQEMFAWRSAGSLR
jgi:D-sedoheptulose 7-phosphate isomerase